MEGGDGAQQKCRLPCATHSCLLLNFPADRKWSWAGLSAAEVQTEQELNMCASPNGSWVFAGWMGLGFAEVKLQFPGRAS